eukprot:142343-Pyramimonas_sp.AAC.1
MFGDRPSFSGKSGEKGVSGSGKGVAGAPSAASAPKLSADEYLQLASLRDKMGDSRAAAAHCTAAAA